jgi:lipid A disaccharide synthetase
LGHPFSQLKPIDNEEVISKYGLDSSKDFISILPGSRASEISQLMPVYVAAAKKLRNLNSNAIFFNTSSK